MKKAVRKTLEGLTFLILVAIIVASYFFATAQQHKDDNKTVIPSRTKITIKSSSTSSFVSEKEIARMLPINISDTIPKVINTYKIDSTLSRISYIKDLSVYISPLSSTLNIKVEERRPILRYMTKGQTYYLDSEGKIMQYHPGSSAYVPLAIGDITQDFVNDELLPLAYFLEKNDKWRNFFASIHVLSDHCIHLYPRIGDFIFELIDTEHLEEDMDKITLFYNEILPRVGANKYKLIKLSYQGQIVCKERD